VLRDTSSIRAIPQTLLPCLLKTRISTVSSTTNMRPSAAEYPTPGWVNFQSAILGQFCIGGNTMLNAIAQASLKTEEEPPK